MTNCTQFDKAIAYYRVSTQKQGESGLGLEAQKSSVRAYAAQHCFEIVEAFVEVETGTSKKVRPEIQKALAAVKQTGAVLLIAQLDRLARSVAFTSALMESGVNFVAVDMPHVDNFTIHILAAVAEKEAQQISKRTKAALQAKRARDGEWRVSMLTDEGRRRGREMQRHRAIANNAQATFAARMLRDAGHSYRAIARQLNENAYRTPLGKPFRAMQVKRMLDRVAG